ncbi:hypothetical protein ACFQ0K_07880 [Nocardioides caeni]|uniref:Uncharacterized protein n=1 Tax=Nocardioides caeni TaxID=574700 RepID=A0A4S8N296_9ACTN|nr:hypothetical protein [Nocardioides caeni]THV10050.1 hypothetical protein E9934_14630 [Nocardioides caeni]
MDPTTLPSYDDADLEAAVEEATQLVTGLPLAHEPATPPSPPAGEPIGYGAFGHNWIRRVLHRDRILRTVEQVLGETIVLGPIKAGPGRTFASVSVVGTFGTTTGVELPGELLAYAIDLPVSVVFHVDLPLDRLTFTAEVVVPLVLTVHTEAPLRLRMELTTPTVDQIGLELSTDTRRGAVFRKMAGLDGELRRFLLKVLDTELSKPYVQRALHLDMEELIDHAWPKLTEQFLPQGPDDRR